ncbi:autotransporter-associated beta strand repeat-containing protein, partial [Polynucleobacter sp. Tro8-14-1]|uniref:autotransporter-associated beta strand repeat-containing protein n=1 Tax=Polynucleobacter sp. Tro8-14-1 TaxID=1758383 RepID=UPI001C0BA3B9
MNSSLNRMFKVIWSKAQGAWVAVSEIVRAHGKEQSLTRITRKFAIAAVMSGGAAIAAPPAANQLPTGGQIAAGVASMMTNGNMMTVTQSSNRAAINWNTFDIGSQASVNFVQPSANSVALNRVNSPNPSQIFGNLTANGQVYLLNSAGVYFAPGAQVNVGGIVATTHSMSDAAFMAGSTTFDRNGSTGKVINEGTIQTSLNGYIAMLAPEVRNTGLLVAQAGTVVMAGGEAISLNFGASSKLESITVTASQIDVLVENRYAIKAPNGLVILSARAMNQLAATVINSGTIEAKGVSQKGGRIVLEGSNVTNTGTLDVSSDTEQAGTITINGKTVAISGKVIATSPVQGGTLKVQATQTLNVNANIDVSSSQRGGQVQIAGAQVAVADASINADGDTQGGDVQVVATNAQSTNPFNDPFNPPSLPLTAALTGITSINSRSRRGQGGNITILGDSITLDDSTAVNVSGATGGGNVLVGGDWQGSNGTYQATTTYMGQNVTIDASATDNGNGGKVVIWSDVRNANSTTTVYGSIYARGGANGGDGGKVETSSHNVDTTGIIVNAGADHGQGGLWLLDPSDSTITQAVANSYQSTLNSGTSILNDVAGSIVWNSGVTLLKSAGADATLTLRTGLSNPNGPITLTNANITSTSGKLNIVLWTANNAGCNGTMNISGSTITTNGGQLWIGGESQSGSTWNGLTVGSGGATNWGTGTALSITNSTMSIGTGNASINGFSYRTTQDTSGTNYGVFMSNSTVQTTNGDIQVVGRLYGNYSQGSAVSLEGTNALISTGTGNITVTATLSDTAGSATGWRNGITVWSTIKTNSGSINITGNTTVAYSGGDSGGVQLSNANVTSQSGAINIIGNNNATGYYDDGIRIQNNNNVIGFDGTNAYSGNILIQSDRIGQRFAYASTNSSNYFRTTGNLTIQSTNGSFTRLLVEDTNASMSFDRAWNFGTALGGLTLGSATNTYDLTLSNTVQTAGNITVYGGNIALNSSLKTTANGSAITINATNNITTASTANTIQTNNGSITLNADSDANNSGLLKLDYMTYSAGTGNITFRGYTFNWNTAVGIEPTITNTTGAFVFESNTASFGQSVDTGWFAFPSTLSSFRVGSLTNTQDVYVSNNQLSVAGPISIYGGNIKLNSSLTTTSNGSGILAKANGNITTADATSFQANNGSLVFWSDANGGSSGYVAFGNNVTLNTANGATSQSSGGGDIIIGGGSNSGNTPTGFAYSTSTGMSGVQFGTTANTSSLLANGNSTGLIYSGGGNVSILGCSTAAFGVVGYGDLQIRSGQGAVNISGNSSYTYGLEFGNNVATGTTGLYIESSKTSGTAISIAGVTTTANNYGVVFDFTDNKYLEATGGGGISVNGAGTGTLYGIFSPGVNYLSSGGPIVINGGTKGIYFNSVANTIGQLAGTNVTSSTANVTITGDVINLGIGTTVNTSGNVSILSNATSFASALSTANLALSTSVASLTVGNTGNTQDITIASAANIAGPISIYGGNISLNANLTSTGSTSEILVKGVGTITGAANLLYQTNNGSLVFWSNSNGGTAGGIAFGNTSTFNTANGNTSQTTGGGALTMGGGTSTGADAAGNTIPTGAALSATTTGISLGTNTNGLTLTTIYTGGGNISINGTSTSSGGVDGVVFAQDSKVNAGSGSINITGNAASGAWCGIELGAASLGNGLGFNITAGGGISLTGIGGGSATGIQARFAPGGSINATGTGAITINGSAGANSTGVNFNMNSTGTAGTLTIDSNSGAINLIGYASGSNGTGINLASNNYIVSSSGNITLNGSSSANSLSLQANFGIGSVVSSSSSNVTLIGDKINFAAPTTVNSSGNFGIYSNSTSFASAFSTTNLTLGTSLASLTIGKTTNSQNVTISNAVNIAGPISVYGNNIFVMANITENTSGVGSLLLQAQNTISVGYDGVSPNVNVTISNGTAGGKLNTILWADSDGSGNGSVWLNNGLRSAGFNFINTNGGGIWIGGGNTTSSVAWTPYAGATTISVGSASAKQDDLIGWYGIGIFNTTLSTSGGNIYMAGNANASGNLNNPRAGIFIGNSSVVKAAGGNINLVGVGGASACGTNFGIELVSTNVSTTGSGAIVINGTGGTAGNYDYGVHLYTANITTESGSLTVNGTGGNSSGLQNAGILSEASTSLSSTAGDINLNGVGGSNVSSANNDAGIWLNSSTIKSTTGNITLTGTKGTGTNSYGIQGNTANGSQTVVIGQYGQTGNISLISNDIFFDGTGSSPNTYKLISNGSVTIAPLGTSFTTALDTSSITFCATANSSLSSVTLGSATNTANITVGSLINVSGPIAVTGGNITLNAGLTTTNNTTGNINLTGNVSGAGNIAVASGLALNVNQSGASTYSGCISGTTAQLIKAGSGTLTLSGANTYSGATNVSAGNLIVSGSLSDSTAVNVSSGAAYNVSATDTIGSFAGVGTINLGSGYVLTAFGDNSSTVFGGTIAGAGGLIKAGTGTLTLNGTDTYTGGTTVNNGTLQVGNAGTTGSLGGGNIAVNNANLTFNYSAGSYTVGNATNTAYVTLNNATVNVSSGNVTLAGYSSTSGTAVGASTMNTAVNLSGVNNLSAASGASLNLLGVSTGAYAHSIALQANSTLNTNGAVTLTANASSGVGSHWAMGIYANTAINAASGSALQINVTQTAGDWGVIQYGSSPTTATSGNVTFNISALAGDLTSVNTGGAVISPSFTSTNGTLTFNFAGVTATTGALYLNGSSAMNATSTGNIIINGSGSSNIYLAAGSSFATGAGNLTINAPINTNGNTLTLSGAAGNVTLNGIVSGAGNLTQNTSGITTLTNANTYTGTTNVSAGTLVVNGSLADATIVNISSGATYNVSSTDTIGSFVGAGTINLGTGYSLTANAINSATTYSGVIAGAGNLVVNGSSVLTLTGASIYTGNTTISAGTLQIGNGTTVGSIASTAAIADNGTLIYNHSDTVTQNLGISGTGTLTQAGSGITILTGANTYSGSTNVTGGTLQIGNGTAVGSVNASSNINISSGASVAFNRTDAITIGNAISGSGALTISQANAVNITGAATYTGNTSVAGGALTFTNTNAPSTGNFTGSGTILIQPNGTSFGAAQSVNYNVANAFTAFTIGSATNAANLTIGSSSALNISGPISLYAGNITLSSSLKSVGANSNLLVKALGSIASGADNLTFQTNNGTMVFWSNANSTSGGGISMLNAGLIFNTANGATNQATGGGDLIFGGGATVDANGNPTGAAVSAGNTITFNPGSAGNTFTKMYTGGGNISINAKSTGGYGVMFDRASVINAGNGSLNIQTNATGNGIEFNAYGGATNGTSITAQGITINASSSGAAAVYAANNGIEFNSTGTGAISITGTSTPAAGNYGIRLGSDAVNMFNLTSASGNITLNGSGGSSAIEYYLGNIKSTSGGSISITANSPSWAGFYQPYTVNYSTTTGYITFNVTGSLGYDAIHLGGGNFTTTTGNISLVGNQTGSQSGINFVTNQTNFSTAGGSVTLNGTAVSNIGLDFGVAVNVTTSGAGAINLYGTSSSSDGIYSGATVNLNASQGTGGISVCATSTSYLGAYINSNFNLIAGAGNINLTGTTAAANQGIYIYSGNITTNSGNINLTGTSGSSYGFDWVLDSGIGAITSTSGNITINGNTGAATYGTYLAGTNISSAGVISINAVGGIYSGSNITSSGAGNALILKATGQIFSVNVSRTYQTNNGSLVFWSNSNGGVAGGVVLQDGNIVLNSANGNTSQLAGGGAIIVGGGTATTTDAAGFVLPTGAVNKNSDWAIEFGGSTTNVAMYSGGGNISIQGNTSGGNAVLFGRNATINAGNGSINIAGCGTLAGVYLNTWDGGAYNIIAKGDISITGSTTGSGTNDYDYSGIRSYFDNTSQGGTIRSTGGNVTLTGSGVQAGLYIYNNNNIISDVGNVTLTGTASSGNRGIVMYGNVLAGGSNINITTTNNNYIFLAGTVGQLAGSNVTSTNANITISGSQLFNGQAPTINTGTGNVTLRANTWSLGTTTIGTNGSISILPLSDTASSGQDVYTSWFNLNPTINGTTYTPNKLTIGNPYNTYAVDWNSNVTVKGGISLYGGEVNITAAMTSNGTGDLWVQGNNASDNYAIYMSGVGSIQKTGGATSNITLRSNSRLQINGNISATGTSANVIEWSDYGNTNYGGNSGTGNITTNGGMVWIGGSSTTNGSLVWNGLTVGDGGSAGSSAANNNAMDFNGNITTSGGDVMVWSGNASVTGGSILSVTSGTKIDAGSGNITLITPKIGSNVLTVNTSGTLTWAPNAAADWGTTGTWNGTVTTGTFTTTSGTTFGNLSIANVSSLANLVLGQYSGMTYANSTAYVASTTANLAYNSSMTGFAGNLSLFAPNIAINSALSSVSVNRVLLSGNATQTAGFIAANLLVQSGNINLSNTSNNVTTFAASNVTNVTYVDANGLTIGTIGSVNGVNASGLVNISTVAGDLALTQTVNTTSTNGTSAIILNAGSGTANGTATGGNITLSGSGNVSSGSGGRITLFTGSIAGSTGITTLIGSGSGRFRYGSNATANGYNATSAALSTGTYAIYREAPTLTISASNATIVYGNSTSSAMSSTTQNGDTYTQIFGAANVPTLAIAGAGYSTAGYLKAGNYTAGITGITTNSLGYGTITYSNGTIQVTKANLTVSGTQVTDAVYSNSTVATFTNNGALGGVLSNATSSVSDVVSLSASGNFSSKNVGSNLSVTLNSSISGADASNYNVVQQTGVTGNITPKTITISDVQVYSGSNSLTNVTIATGVAGETLTYTAATANSGHVADNSTNYITAITLGNQSGATLSAGGLVSNYQLPTLTARSASNTVNITAANLALATTGNVTKTYDGTANATVGLANLSITGLVSGDSLTLSNLTTAAFNST